MPVADAAGDEIVELVGRHLFVRRTPSDPQEQPVAAPMIAVQMHAISTRTKKRDRTPVESKDRWHFPAWGDGEGLVAPFRNAMLGDESVDDRVDCPAYGVHAATRHQFDPLLADSKDITEASQHVGIVATQESEPGVPGCERHDARRIKAV